MCLVHFWLKSVKNCNFLAKIVVHFQSELIFEISIWKLLLCQISNKSEENKEARIFYPNQSQNTRGCHTNALVMTSSNTLLFLGRVFDVIWHYQISWLLTLNYEATEGEADSPLPHWCQILQCPACSGLINSQYFNSSISIFWLGLFCINLTIISSVLGILLVWILLIRKYLTKFMCSIHIGGIILAQNISKIVCIILDDDTLFPTTNGI